MTVRVLQGDCREMLATLPDESAHCVVTSPPYWGLRDYGVAGQLGLEATPDEHVAAMVGVFRSVRRVLRSDGTLWLNYGDCYAGNVNGRSSRDTKILGRDDRTFRDRPFSTVGNGLKPKDLVGMPWRIAFALQADGWWLRSDIIWHKPNPMPESVTDRPTSAHEHVFLLTKNARYFYDAESVREPAIHAGKEVRTNGNEGMDAGYDGHRTRDGLRRGVTVGENRNLRNVWTIATAPFSEAHFATFPPALVEPCIKAGTSERGCCPACGAPWVRQVNRQRLLDGETPVEGGWSQNDAGQIGADGKGHWRVTTSSETTGWSPPCSCGGDPVPCTILDPFGGAGTVGLVADRLQRNAVLIELNPAYAQMARNRIATDGGMFAQVAE